VLNYLRDVYYKQDDKDGKTMGKNKDVTWEDIEKQVEELKKNPIKIDDDVFEDFKKKMLNHLDNLQAEEDKKIIPFPVGRNTKKNSERNGN
jgi:hypothetical protein